VGILDGFRKNRKGEYSPVFKAQPLSRGQATMGTYEVGENIGDRYKILEVLGGPGISGMGTVYVCRDQREAGVIVALKTLQERFLSDQAAVDGFKREAEVWIGLGRHHNIVNAMGVALIQRRP
jgi:serine/threonine protein kinase